jgi:hypothetical protein
VSEGRREARGEVRTSMHGLVGKWMLEIRRALDVGNVCIGGHLGGNRVHTTPPCRLVLYKFKRCRLPTNNKVSKEGMEERKRGPKIISSTKERTQHFKQRLAGRSQVENGTSTGGMSKKAFHECG